MLGDPPARISVSAPSCSWGRHRCGGHVVSSSRAREDSCPLEGMWRRVQQQRDSGYVVPSQGTGSKVVMYLSVTLNSCHYEGLKLTVGSAKRNDVAIIRGLPLSLFSHCQSCSKLNPFHFAPPPAAPAAAAFAFFLAACAAALIEAMLSPMTSSAFSLVKKL
jgi:hypothetical protein